MTGSAPSVRTTTQPTVSPAQQNLIDALAGPLQGVGPGTTWAVPSFGSFQSADTSQYAAPLSGLQTSSLGGIQNLINAYTSGPVSGQPGVSGPLSQATSSVAGATTANPVSMIDPTQAFNQGVVQPLTQDFTNYTIPAIAGKYGASAGGGFSSDALGARQQAGTDLARTLAQAGSTYSLNAAAANQQAQATNARLQQSAAALLPQLLAAPTALDTGQEQLLGGGLSAGAVPQATEQTQLAGQYQNYSDVLKQLQGYLGDALGLSTAGTQQTQSVVNPGSTGFLAPLLAALVGGASRGYTGTYGLTSGGLG